MPTKTSNYDFNKPIVDSAEDEDLWGGQLNDNWDSVDELLNRPILSKSAAYTVTTSDVRKVIAADGSSSGFTITLPVGATAGSGFEITVIKTDFSSNAITVDGDSSEKINNENNYILNTVFGFASFKWDGTEWKVVSKSPAAPNYRGQLNGLNINNNSSDSDHDIDIAPGIASDSTNKSLIELDASLTIAIDASGAGGLDSGSVSADTVYYVFIIQSTSDGTVSGIFSTSKSSPTIPSGYDRYRRIGSVATDAIGNIKGFFQRGDIFTWHEPIMVEETGSLPTTRANYSTVCPASETAVLSLTTSADKTVIHYGLLQNPDFPDEVPTSDYSNFFNAGVGSDSGSRIVQKYETPVDSSSRVSLRFSSSSGNSLRLKNTGFIDNREK